MTFRTSWYCSSRHGGANYSLGSWAVSPQTQPWKLAQLTVHPSARAREQARDEGLEGMDPTNFKVPPDVSSQEELTVVVGPPIAGSADEGRSSAGVHRAGVHRAGVRHMFYRGTPLASAPPLGAEPFAPSCCSRGRPGADLRRPVGGRRLKVEAVGVDD